MRHQRRRLRRARPTRGRARARSGLRSSAAPEAVRPLGLARTAEKVPAAPIALHVLVVGGELRLHDFEMRVLELAVQAAWAPPPIALLTPKREMRLTRPLNSWKAGIRFAPANAISRTCALTCRST